MRQDFGARNKPSFWKRLTRGKSRGSRKGNADESLSKDQGDASQPVPTLSSPPGATGATGATGARGSDKAPDSTLPEFGPLTLPEYLWDRAYNGLKESNSSLVTGYEKVLSRELQATTSSSTAAASTDQHNIIAQNSPLLRRSQMNNLTQLGLEKTAKVARAKEVTGKVLQVVKVAKDMISTAIQAAPHAAVAWAGVCFALQMVENPINEFDANKAGVIYVIDRMNWYWNLSALLLTENVDEHFIGVRSKLEDKIIELYQALLSYQMASVCTYYRNQGLVFLQDLIQLNQWEGNLKSIQDAEKCFETDSKTFNMLQIRSNLKELLDVTKNNQGEGLLRDIYNALQNDASQRKESQMKEEDRKCLRDLVLTKPSDDLVRIETDKDTLLPDSYAWILTRKEFTAWKNEDRTRILWIKGHPGKGKTMLLIGVVKEFLALTEEGGLLSFFFCQANDPKLNNFTAILRGLIYQMIVQDMSLISHIRERYDIQGPSLFHDLNAHVALAEIFTKILHSAGSSKMYLVVDALDECQEGLSRLLDLIRLTSSNRRVKWLLSSRHRFDIEDGFKPVDYLAELDLEKDVQGNVSDAVSAYIDHKVLELAKFRRYNGELQENVRSYLKANANGTFLWVALVCKQLASPKTSLLNTLPTLKSFPLGLPKFYQRMMDEMRNLNGEYDLEICRRTLAVVTLAYQPINLEELVAFADLPAELLYDLQTLEEIIGRCGSFLFLRRGVIYFVHQSAKDYLMKAEADIFPHGRDENHDRMVSQSIQMMSSTLRKDIYNLRDPGCSIYQIPAFDAGLDPLASLGYACCHWVHHLEQLDTRQRQSAGFCEDGQIHLFLETHLLHWLEALSLMRKMSDGVLAVTKLMSLSANLNSTLTDFLQDANRFVLFTRPIIEARPLQVYASALVFSPETSVIKRQFVTTDPTWIESWSGLEDSWSPCLQTIEAHCSGASCVAFSTDGRRLASGSYHENKIRIWDAETGALEVVLESQDPWVQGLAFSVDGERLAVATRKNILQIFNTRTASLAQLLKGHEYAVNDVAFSSDGRWLASCSNDAKIILWNGKTGVLEYILTRHQGVVCAVMFSPDGKKLASAARDEGVIIWNVKTRTVLHTLKHQGTGPCKVLFCPGETQVVTAAHDVEFWDVNTESRLRIFEHGSDIDDVGTLALSPNGRLIASSVSFYDREIRLWDTNTGNMMTSFKGNYYFNAVAFSPDGRRLASASHDGNVQLWDVEKLHVQETARGHSSGARQVLFSPDGQQVASVSTDEGSVRLWDVSTGASRHVLDGHSSKISAMYSPNGRILMSLSTNERAIRLWDTQEGTLQYKHSLTQYFPPAYEFSPDGEWLAIGSQDGGLIYLFHDDMKDPHILEYHKSEIQEVVFSQDGTQLASSSEESICIWSTGTKTLAHAIQQRGLTVMEFSADGGLVLSATRKMSTDTFGNIDNIQVWDTDTGVLKRDITGYYGDVWKAKFSPDGNLLVGICRDNSARIFHFDSKDPLTVAGHNDEFIFDFAISSDGAQLATLSHETLCLWDTKTGALQQRLNDYTDKESKAYWENRISRITEQVTLDLTNFATKSITSPEIWSPYAISKDRSWITWKGHEILWIPPTYRPLDCSIRGNVVAMGHESGMVSIIKFKPDNDSGTKSFPGLVDIGTGGSSTYFPWRDN